MTVYVCLEGLNSSTQHKSIKILPAIGKYSSIVGSWELGVVRLTRRLGKSSVQFLGYGKFIVCPISTSLIIVCNMQQNQHMWHHLAMFFRDELLSWSWRRPLGMPLAPVPGGGLSPADFKHKVTTNVEHVIGRINGIAPQSLSDEVLGSFLSLFPKSPL